MAASTASQVVRRALLYVPGSSKRFLDKSRSIAAVDCIAYDLEDSVTPSQKPNARQNILSTLNTARAPGIREQAVRINAVDSGYALEDLTTILGGTHLDALVIPKVNSAADLHFVTDVLRHILPVRHPSSPSTSSDPAPPLRIIALIESARAVMNLREICTASPYLHGLIFAAEDFAADMSITRTPSLSEFAYARSAIATAARAHGLPSAIDLVNTTFRGEEGRRVLEEESAGGKRMGFNGKQCIHPDQVEVVQRVFAPGEDEVDWAVRVVVAEQKADSQGRGAWTLDGKMIDRPVVLKAQAIVHRAEACGFNVGSVKEKFKDVQPE